MRSIDSILLKGDIMVRKIFTMRNSLGDSDGYNDPGTLQIDEVPKTLQFPPTVNFIGQVITVTRVLENSSTESSNAETDETKQNTTQGSFQSENKNNYKYAFGSRVKSEEEFDKGLGVVGFNKDSLNQQKRVPTAPKQTPSGSQKRTTAPVKTTEANKLNKKKAPLNKPPKGILKTEQKPTNVQEELKEPNQPIKKDASQIEIELHNQKLKLEKELGLIAKEEQKLEMLRKKRKDLYSNPFKHIKELDSKEIQEKRKAENKKKNEVEELEGNPKHFDSLY